MSDLISRQAAIDGLDVHYIERINLNDWQTGWNAALDWMKDVYLDEFPSAQPETHDKRTETHACDLIDRQQVLNLFPTHDWKHLYDAVKDLPSAQPERKRGKWELSSIMHSTPPTYMMRCSECGMETFGTHDFCPNCGAMMRIDE